MEQEQFHERSVHAVIHDQVKDLIDTSFKITFQVDEGKVVENHRVEEFVTPEFLYNNMGILRILNSLYYLTQNYILSPNSS